MRKTYPFNHAQTSVRIHSTINEEDHDLTPPNQNARGLAASSSRRLELLVVMKKLKVENCGSRENMYSVPRHANNGGPHRSQRATPPSTVRSTFAVRAS